MGKFKYKENGVWKSVAPSQQEFDDLVARIGNNSELKTDNKTSIVGAINEVKDDLDNIDLNAKSISLTSSNFTSTNIQDGMDELFTNVSNGKNQIATAITDMGQSASGSDTFSQLATKIKDISKDANATVEQVLTGRTFYQGGAKQTGTMPDRGAVTHTITTQNGSYTIPAGYHNGSGTVTASFSNLTADNIRQGVNIGGIVGTYAGLGSVEKVIRGTFSFPAGETLVNVTIPSVVLNSSIVNHTHWTSGSPYKGAFFSVASLTSATNIRFERYRNTSEPVTINWEVIQFNNVKARYVGNSYTNRDTVLGSASSININKCLLYWSFIAQTTSNDATPYLREFPSARLYSVGGNVVVRFDAGNSFLSPYCYYQVIEFL